MEAEGVTGYLFLGGLPTSGERRDGALTQIFAPGADSVSESHARDLVAVFVVG